MVSEILRQRPGSDILYNEGEKAFRNADFDTAEHCFRLLIQQDPPNPQFRQLYIESLINQYKYDFAKRSLNLWLKKNKGSLHFLNLRARVAMLSGDFKQAEKDMLQQLKTQPQSSDLHQTLGHIYRDYDFTEKAKECYAKALSLNKEQGQSYRLLKSLYTASEETDLDRDIASDLSSGKRCHSDFYFGLGKLYEDLGQYDRAWSMYLKGNNIVHIETRKNQVEDFCESGRSLRNDILRYIEMPGTKPLERNLNVVLVAGFPRSGTTMLEQVIASDKHFTSCGELVLCGNAIKELRTQKKEGLALHEDDVKKLGDYYAKGIQNLKIGKTTAIDKGVTLFRSGGLMLMAYRNIKMIHLLRDPKDTILSNFKARFANSHQYAFRIEDIINYLAFYYENIKIWKELFSERVRFIDYDSYVVEPQKHNESLANWLSADGTIYNITFRKDKKAVHTASAVQLGDKIRNTSSGKSKPYEPFLKKWEDKIAPLYEMLDKPPFRA